MIRSDFTSFTINSEVLSILQLLVKRNIIFCVQNHQVISMKSSQKYTNKDFSLSQYYHQLQRYQTNSSTNKKTALKKQYSVSSFTKDVNKSSNLAKTYKDSFPQEKNRLGLSEKYGSKVSFDKFDKSRLENIKKQSSPAQHIKANSYLGDSLNSSNLSYKHWNTSEIAEKQNIDFGSADQSKFIEHCSQLYNISENGDLTSTIEKQISKRDEVYQVIADKFSNQPEANYSSALKRYFSEHELMLKIIGEFKSISKLEVDDLSELYYFLKSDH